jgi:hypothetical protein
LSPLPIGFESITGGVGGGFTLRPVQDLV